MLVGKKIYELRKLQQFSQEELAERINVSRQTISNWETDQTVPDLYQARELAKVLKISLDELALVEKSKEILYERAYRRHLETGAPLRNRNLQEVKDEINAEEFYFNELIIRKSLENYIISTDNLTQENVYTYVKKHILERKK